MADPGQQSSSPPTAPPTVPAPLVSPERSSGWPGLIGVIAIVFGSLGTIAGVWSFVSLIFLPKLTELMSAGGGLAVASPEQMHTSIIFQGATAVPLGVLLLVAGIAMLRRRRRAVRLGVTWALLKMPVVVIGTVLAVSVQRATTQAIAQSTGGPPLGFFSTFLWFGVAVGVLWGWSLPIFLLVWFSRRSIKEETASWS